MLGFFLKEHKRGEVVSKGGEPISDKTMVGVCKERPTTTPTLALSLQEYHTICAVLLIYVHIS